jgi:hypothetical protein
VKLHTPCAVRLVLLEVERARKWSNRSSQASGALTSRAQYDCGLSRASPVKKHRTLGLVRRSWGHTKEIAHEEISAEVETSLNTV